MARRRMFSLDVIDTDVFLEMPASTQNLYFHLGMRADDDGFVSSPKKTMKAINSSEDDMKILLAKQFVIPFDSGICVIKHWRIHNYIQNDRYKETRYLEEKENLSIQDDVYILDTNPIQGVSNPYTQVRLGKDRISKDRIEDNAEPVLKSDTAIMKADPLYHAIFESFIGKAGAFTNYPKEAQAIKRIIKYCEQHSPMYSEGDKIKLAEMAITKYYELTQNGDRFWRGQPFTPSNLSAPGIFDRVLVEIGQKKEMQDATIPTF